MHPAIPHRRLSDLLLLMANSKASLFFLLFVLTGCILAYGNTLHRFLVIGVFALLCLIVLLAFRQKRFWYALCLPFLTGILFGSVCSLLLFDGYVAQYQNMAAAEKVVSVRGSVTKVVHTTSWYGLYILRVTGNGLPYSVSLSSSVTDYQEGDVLAGEIRLQPWDSHEDTFNEWRYHLSEGIVSEAEDVSLVDTRDTYYTLKGLFSCWNRYLSAKITAHVQNDGLPLAMLLGNREELSDSVKRDFKRLGILHLLAVSGTHFSMLASMMERLFIRLHVHPRYRNWLLLMLTVLYMFLTGLSASVLRAGVMFMMMLVCRMLELKMRYWSALNIGCGLICLFDPFAVLDMGLHLSYMAVCGCLISVQMVKNWSGWNRLWKIKRTDSDGKPVRLSRRQRWIHRMGKNILTTVMMTLIITCLLFPLSWLYFGELSLFSLAANIFYVPATGGLLFLTLLYLLLYPLVFPVLPMAKLLSAYVTLLELPAALFSAIPHISLSLDYAFVPLFILPLGIGACMMPFIRRKLLGMTVLFSLLCLLTGTILVYEQATADQTHLVYRNDRLQEGFVIRSGSEVLLIDITDGTYGFTDSLTGDAKKLYATELGGYMLTHYHNRHVSTLQRLMDNWILRRLYLPVPTTDGESAIYRSLLEIAERNGVTVIPFDTETDFHHVHITLPSRTWLSRSSHPVTGLVLETEGTVLVYGSSSCNEGNEQILSSFLSADICIFGAHSPVYKKEFALSFVMEPDYVIWNGSAASYYTGKRLLFGQELHQCTRFVYRFPDAAA